MIVSVNRIGLCTMNTYKNNLTESKEHLHFRINFSTLTIKTKNMSELATNMQ